MARTLSVRTVTLCHAALGGMIGAFASAGMSLSGAVTVLSRDHDASIVVLLALSSWMAVGAGLTGFILTNVDRAGDAG